MKNFKSIITHESKALNKQLGDLLTVFQIPCRAADGCTRVERSATFGGMMDASVGFLVVILLTVTPWLLSRRLKVLREWRPFVRLSIGTSLSMILCLIGAMVPSVQGLFERILVMIAAGWAIVLAVNVIRTSQNSR